MRWGRSSLVVGILVVVTAIGGTTASAADSPRVSAVAVLVTSPDADAVATPAAEVPGDAAVSAPSWRSSDDAPVVTLVNAWSSAAGDASSASGRTVLRGVQVLGGEIQLRGLRLSASADGTNAPAIDDLLVRHLTIDGQPVDPPAPGGDPVALGDWGTLSAGVATGDAGDPGVAGLLIEVTADHDGLSAGSEIVLGWVHFTPPADTTGGGTGNGGSGGNGGTGNSGGGSGGTQPPGGGGGDQPSPPAKGTHHHHGQTRNGGGRHHRVVVHHPDHLPKLPHGVRARIVAAAAQQIGWPYVWGGESRAEGGFDCSGLVDYSYAMAGHPLPGRPTAAVLWQMGIPIARDQLRPGDLAFLGAPSGEPYHVALYAGHDQVIVASGRGLPIRREPLEAVSWDGFARIWAAGGIDRFQDARWLTGPAHKALPSVLDLHADLIAASRALDPAPARNDDHAHRTSVTAGTAPRPRRREARDDNPVSLTDLRPRAGARAAATPTGP